MRELEHGAWRRSERRDVVRRRGRRQSAVFGSEVECVPGRQRRCRLPIRTKALILFAEGREKLVEPEVVVTAFSAGPVPRNARSPFRNDVARDRGGEKPARNHPILSRAFERKEPGPHALREPLVERFGADCRGVGPNAAMEVQDLDANLVGECLRLLRNRSDPREGLGAYVARERNAIDCAHLPPWIQPPPTRQAGANDGRSLAPTLEPEQPEDSRKGSRHVDAVAALLSGLARLG